MFGLVCISRKQESQEAGNEGSGVGPLSREQVVSNLLDLLPQVLHKLEAGEA